MEGYLSKGNRLLKMIEDSGRQQKNKQSKLAVKEMRRNYDDMYVSIKSKCDYIMTDFMKTAKVTEIGFKGNSGNLSAK